MYPHLYLCLHLYLYPHLYSICILICNIFVFSFVLYVYCHLNFMDILICISCIFSFVFVFSFVLESAAHMQMRNLHPLMAKPLRTSARCSVYHTMVQFVVWLLYCIVWFEIVVWYGAVWYCCNPGTEWPLYGIVRLFYG